MMVAVALGEAKVVGFSARLAVVTRGEDISIAAWQCGNNIAAEELGGELSLGVMKAPPWCLPPLSLGLPRPTWYNRPSAADTKHWSCWPARPQE